MLQLRAYASPEQIAVVEQRLVDVAGVGHVIVGATTRGLVLLSAELEPDVADVVLDVLRGCDLPPDDVTLLRETSIRPLSWGRRRPEPGGDQTVWAELAGHAREHARISPAYVVYMAAAGVVAGVGVLTGSSILVVGAMALSPDLLPISAAAVGLVDRRWPLTVRALSTLLLGLGVAMISATAATTVLRLSGRIDQDLHLADTVLGPSLTNLGPGSVLVALAAGVAGMMAYETASGAAVGVAISITTIPAVAYLGDAIGLGRQEDGLGALGVLATNVVCIVTAATVTLTVQRRHRSSGRR